MSRLYCTAPSSQGPEAGTEILTRLCDGLQVFDIDDRKAWGAVALTTGAVAASIAMIAYSPWYLLPFAWAFAGTAWTGVSHT